jgi:mono/diheme cytochrome c family protein
MTLALLLASTLARADGAATYAALCAGCHGAAGAGDGVAAASLPVKVPSFADPTFWSRSDAVIKKSIKKGGASVGKSSIMVPNPQLTPAQLNELVVYLKTLKKG